MAFSAGNAVMSMSGSMTADGRGGLEGAASAAKTCKDTEMNPALPLTGTAALRLRLAPEYSCAGVGACLEGGFGGFSRRLGGLWADFGRGQPVRTAARRRLKAMAVIRIWPATLARPM